eukprot:CAMPEP_0172518820 /NCGR_PEP_ID=MMETSP1066-20121228/291043_1 /TAXON_ID=671091 /ORGANISM="Coscinodiscus wailesii, Strain CCMP2513" /LENGTH=141 /DNA_ID=CAMNT_0013301271 /DNA_START=6 /DNA_END=431 /DNA_ORIENTATION=+
MEVIQQQQKEYKEWLPSPSQLLTNILDLVANVSTRLLLKWTKFCPLSRFTARARLASLTRVLNLSIPAASNNELKDDDTAKKRGSTRSFLVVLPTIASFTKEKNGNKSGNNSGIDILTIECDARRKSKRPLQTPTQGVQQE